MQTLNVPQFMPDGKGTCGGTAHEVVIQIVGVTVTFVSGSDTIFLVESKGVEPSTSAVRLRRSPN
jgi:hypothetical protein